MMSGRQWAAIGAFGATIAAYGIINRLTVAHLLVLGIVCGFAAVPRTRWIGMALLPVSMFVLAYDLLRVFAERAVHVVTIKPVYDLELAIFGIQQGERLITPNEWIVGWLSTPLDLYGGVVYSTHVPPLILVGIYVLWRSRERTESDLGQIGAYFWGMFVLNIIAYTTMLLFPVAPPWYVEAFGFAMPTEVVTGNPARLARVDAWLGYEYFTTVYAQGAYTFGAVPSLHCAYPFYAALHIKNRWGAAFAWFWTASMIFYAVYLNHHYIVDVIAGVALAVGVWAVFQFSPVHQLAKRLYTWQLSLFPVRPRPEEAANVG